MDSWREYWIRRAARDRFGFRMTRTHSLRRWPFVALLLLSLLALLYCWAGVMMAGSFTVANPERLEHWRRVAYVYLALCALALVGIVTAMVVILRRTIARAGRVAEGGQGLSA